MGILGHSAKYQYYQIFQNYFYKLSNYLFKNHEISKSTSDHIGDDFWCIGNPCQRTV